MPKPYIVPRRIGNYVQEELFLLETVPTIPVKRSARKKPPKQRTPRHIQKRNSKVGWKVMQARNKR